MNAWLDWPDSPGPWWMRREHGEDVIVEAIGTSGDISVFRRGKFIFGYDVPGTKFQKVQPPDSDPPQWHDRPTCAGGWLLLYQNPDEAFYSYLDDETVANWITGKPTRYFGPIPDDKPIQREAI